MNATRICSEAGCDAPERGLGLCNKHYKRLRKTKGLLRTCAVDGCDTLHRINGMCARHDRMHRPRGPISETAHPGGIRTCSIEACTLPHSGLGFCKMHYKRFKKHGDAAREVRPPGRPSTPIINGLKICNICLADKPVHAFYARKRAGRAGYSSACKSCQNERSADYARANVEKSRASALDSYRRAKAEGKPWKIFDSSETRARKWNHREGIAGAHVTAAQIDSRFAVFGNRCWMCDAEGALTVDHVKPRSKGGPHLAANIRPACRPCNARKYNHWRGASRVNEFKVQASR